MLHFEAETLSPRHCTPLKEAIHISSKMEILEHGKEKTIVKFENLWKIVKRLGKVGFPTKPNSGSSCAESLVGPFARIVGTSNVLTRSIPCYKGSKSEIRGVGEGIGDR
ncbi:hypothetical protein AVEN_165526-1 [Araneus ventricosus]|uniref:Uncharacterized protein n=1 Tax=Araneus ventricosus TaxID=182803 RepID=A0A4Y2SNP1_ARAVE|nr:hypothetical protein AVEN_165526-1 [Araneus ventricosus]